MLRTYLATFYIKAEVLGPWTLVQPATMQSGLIVELINVYSRWGLGARHNYYSTRPTTNLQTINMLILPQSADLSQKLQTKHVDQRNTNTR